jgi:hypothetical protein
VALPRSLAMPSLAPTWAMLGSSLQEMEALSQKLPCTGVSTLFHEEWRNSCPGGKQLCSFLLQVSWGVPGRVSLPGAIGWAQGTEAGAPGQLQARSGLPLPPL